MHNSIHADALTSKAQTHANGATLDPEVRTNRVTTALEDERDAAIARLIDLRRRLVDLIACVQDYDRQLAYDFQPQLAEIEMRLGRLLVARVLTDLEAPR